MLVDSHALLWFLAGDDRLGQPNRLRIEAGAVVSAASIWEIGIKVALGKLEAPDDLPTRVVDLGFDYLSVTPEHAWYAKSLPPHHRDPFDRLLIAQALVEEEEILTADSAFAKYDAIVVWDR